MIKFFKPEDFQKNFEGTKLDWAMVYKNLADFANEKLERAGRVMWHYDSEDRWQFNGDSRHATLKALLINVEPIEKCKHPYEKIKKIVIVERRYLDKIKGGTHVMMDDKFESEFECTLCDAKLKPKEFEEII